MNPIKTIVHILLTSMILSSCSTSSPENIVIINQDNCPSGVIPETMIFEDIGENNIPNPLVQDFGHVAPDKALWADGKDVDWYSQPNFISRDAGEFVGNVCRYGSAVGENVNYLYCDNLHYKLSRKEVASDGTVIRVESGDYQVSIIMKMINFTTRPYILNENIYSHVINYSIISAKCRRV